VTLKIRLRPFRTHTRSRTMPEATRDPDRVRAVARELLDAFELDAPVRLIGVGVAGLTRQDGEVPGPEEAPRIQQALSIDA
jgi:DNA polymerase-4